MALVIDFCHMIYCVVNATRVVQRTKCKLYSSNCGLCHETGDFCLTNSLAARWIVSLWRSFTLIYPDLHSRTRWWFSWISSNFTNTDQTPDLGNFEDILKLGCNFVYSNSDPFFPLSGCVSCVMVLSPALAACNENLHSPLPANFCPWQPRLSVIFIYRTGSQKAIGSWRNPSRGKKSAAR